MLRDLSAKEEIVRASDQLLRVADSRGALPTPVEDLVGAAGLTASNEMPFDESVLRRAPACSGALGGRGSTSRTQT
jgi:hypothetical protein